MMQGHGAPYPDPVHFYIVDTEQYLSQNQDHVPISVLSSAGRGFSHKLVLSDSNLLYFMLVGYITMGGFLRGLACFFLIMPSASAQAGKSNEHFRWFDLQTATLNTRYRYVESSALVISANQMQHKESFRGRLKFDRQ